MRDALVLMLSACMAACQGSGAPDDDVTPAHGVEVPRVSTADEALSGAHVPTVDPSWLNDAEIRAVLGSTPYCVFRYAGNGRPVLALTQDEARSPAGVVKLNGFLVPLSGRPAAAGIRQVSAGPARATLMKKAEGDRKDSANLIFEVDGRLRAGYAGYSDCLS